MVDGMEIARTSSLSGCEHRVPLRALGVIGGGRNFGGCDLGGKEPGEGASGATTASDMDVEEGAAGPRDAAGGADVGAVGGQDGTDPVSTGGEAVVNTGSEYLAVDAAVTGVAASIKGPGQPPATRQRTTSASGEGRRVTSAFVNPLRSCGVDALPRQYASHSLPRRHRRDCVSMTASARWRERLELLNVVDWGLSRLPPALRINGDVSRSRFAFASDRWLPMDLVPHLSDGVSATREECPVRARVVPDGSPLVLHRRVAAPWTGTSLC